MKTHADSTGSVGGVVSILHDDRRGGGLRTANSWYRRWMDINRPEARRELYLDHFGPAWDFLRSWRSWRPDQERIPRLLPRLRVPQYAGARWLIRRSGLQVEEAHVVGGPILHGSLVMGIPSVLWIGTAIGDERRRVRSREPFTKRVAQVLLPIEERVERSVIERSSKILAQSVHTADQLVNLGAARERIEILPVPIDLEVFRPSTESREGLLFVGRATDPRKNFDAVIKLLERSALIREHGVTVISPTQPKVPASLRRFVRFDAEVSDLPDRYRRAEALILTSVQEGYGIVAFEAMASGLPVVICRCGGPDRAVTDSGGGIVCDNFEELLSAAERVLGDVALQRDLGAKGRTWSITNVSAADFLSDPRLFALG